MEDRIQVNGVWYVKETTKAVVSYIEEFDVTRSLARVWENDDYAFEAKILLAPDGTELEDTWGDCWLTITEKVGHTNASWVEHSIDNPRWMLGVYEGDPLSMEEATKMMTSEGIRYGKTNIHNARSIISFRRDGCR